MVGTSAAVATSVARRHSAAADSAIVVAVADVALADLVFATAVVGQQHRCQTEDRSPIPEHIQRGQRAHSTPFCREPDRSLVLVLILSH